jgi:hypothetical protein
LTVVSCQLSSIGQRSANSKILSTALRTEYSCADCEHTESSNDYCPGLRSPVHNRLTSCPGCCAWCRWLVVGLPMPRANGPSQIGRLCSVCVVAYGKSRTINSHALSGDNIELSCHSLLYSVRGTQYVTNVKQLE